MNKPVVVCFSYNKNKLSHLLYELDEYYDTSVEKKCFEEEDLFFNFLAKSSNANNYVQLIVLEVDDSNKDSNQFISTVNQFYPNTFKLIITNKSHYLEIQRIIKNSESLQFLDNSWSKLDLFIVLNFISSCYTAFEKIDDKQREESSCAKKIEVEITARLQELKDTNVAKDKFLSIISHDLKSPFHALLGISDVLIDEWDNISEENRRELVSDLQKTSKDTFKLLEDLLDWSKAQREKLEISINEIKIKNVVDSSIKISASNATPKGIEIKNNIQNGLKVNADKNMIATVFRNLLSNAVKFTPPGGKIDISVEEDKNFCTFCVADNGKGIEKKYILDLFNRQNPKRINGNLKTYRGLGLFLCKDFVERNGGKIWLETQKGEGSKFFFTVPC